MGVLECVKLRGTTYYFRRKVPSRLVKRIGKTEIVRSLGTGSLKQARSASTCWWAATERMFRAMGHDSRLTKTQIDQMMREWVDGLLDKAEYDLATTGRAIDLNAESAFFIDQQEILDSHAETFRHDMRLGEFDNVAPVMDSFCQEHGLTIDKGSPDYKVLARAVMRGIVEYSETVSKRLEGDYEPYAGPARPSPPSGHQSTSTASPKNAPLFSEASDEYLTRMKVDEEFGWDGQSVAQAKATTRLFIAFVGDKPIDLYTRQDGAKFEDQLRRMPAKWGKSKLDQRSTPQEIIERADRSANSVKRISPRTQRRHFSVLNSLWADQKHRGMLSDETTFHGFVKKTKGEKAQKPNEQRNMWSPEKLDMLFGCPLWTGCKSRGRRSLPGSLVLKDFKYWIPIIGALHGMRLEEICQLHVTDIKTDDDIVYFDVFRDDEHRIKTRAGSRKIPLHSDLIALGFLDYVKEARRHGHDRVFPEMERTGPSKKFGPKMTKAFGILRKNIGAYELLMDFHSFRHNVETQMQNALLDQRVINEVIGHINPKEETPDRYHKGFEIHLLKEAIDAVNIPAIKALIK